MASRIVSLGSNRTKSHFSGKGKQWKSSVVGNVPMDEKAKVYSTLASATDRLWFGRHGARITNRNHILVPCAGDDLILFDHDETIR